MSDEQVMFKACVKCRGDLWPDEGDWKCFQCGTYYYVRLPKLLPIEKERGQRSQPRGTVITYKKALENPKAWLEENADIAQSFKDNNSDEDIAGTFDWSLRFVQNKRSVYNRLMGQINREREIGTGK